MHLPVKLVIHKKNNLNICESISFLSVAGVLAITKVSQYALGMSYK